MRTTLTLADDVAAQLLKLQQARHARFKDVVNEALRAGLQQLAASRRPRAPFATGTADLGRCLIGSVDDTSEALAVAEGEDHHDFRRFPGLSFRNPLA